MNITIGRGRKARSISVPTGHAYCKKSREERTSFVNTMCSLLGVPGRSQ